MSENVWFTADEHYGHNNIISFCNRPYKNLAEMHKALIANHNAVVKPGDRVYHNGDMFWGALPDEEAIAIRYQLNGQHYYIWGNHDELIKRNKTIRDSFIWLKDTENLKISGYPNVFLCHYAMKVWNGSHRGAYHLYGHTHGVLKEDNSLSFDVGVDAQDYYPISIEAVHERMKRKLMK